MTKDIKVLNIRLLEQVTDKHKIKGKFIYVSFTFISNYKLLLAFYLYISHLHFLCYIFFTLSLMPLYFFTSTIYAHTLTYAHTHLQIHRLIIYACLFNAIQNRTNYVLYVCVQHTYTWLNITCFYNISYFLLLRFSLFLFLIRYIAMANMKCCL